MPHYDPSKAEGGFDPIPAGTYRCKFTDVTDKNKEGAVLKSKSGDEMFSIRLTVIEGEHEGAVIYDYLVFGGKGLNRVKILLGALGFDNEKALDVTTGMIQDQTVRVDIIQTVYEGKAQNKVAFAGYKADETPSF